MALPGALGTYTGQHGPTPGTAAPAVLLTGDGGGIYNEGSLDITNSTISGDPP